MIVFFDHFFDAQMLFCFPQHERNTRSKLLLFSSFKCIYRQFATRLHTHTHSHTHTHIHTHSHSHTHSHTHTHIRTHS